MNLALLGVMVALLSVNDGTASLAKNEPLALKSITPNQTQVPRRGVLELTLDVGATYDNPFDPEEIDVFALFTAPDGNAIRVNGFLNQIHARRLENDQEMIESAGAPVWMIRFSPDMEGKWTYGVHAKDRSGEVTAPEASFDVVASPNSGFIQVCTQNPNVFAYENGQPCFLVGENMCWSWKRGTYDYEDWLTALSAAGGNWIRIWMCSWNCGLEWTGSNFAGLGVYNLSNAWKLDAILDSAQEKNVAVMLCLGTYGEFTTGGYFNEGQWHLNPYNAANGGPCEKPGDFWKNETARKLYQRRLRYLAARYGWRSNLHSWEFWNEAHATPAWVEEMANYLKGMGPFAGQPADPHGHLVSTTYGTDRVWKLSPIDFTQTHHYGTGNIPDSAPVIHEDALKHVEYGKPHLMAEFGIDYRTDDKKYDPAKKGVNLHNGLWASVMSGNAGSAMIWYWDGYVHPNNLYYHFAAVRKFCDAVPWAAGAWETLNLDAPERAGGTMTWSDLLISPTCGWEKCKQTEFTISPDQGVGDAALPEFIFSPGKADLRTTPVFKVDYAHPGRFVVSVNTVSMNARLRFLLDDTPAGEVFLSAAPPADPNAKPEYKTTEFKQEYGIHQAVFNKPYGIDVPAGEHRIMIEVTEGDWLSISNYVLTGYATDRFPRMNMYGLRHGGEAILWAQNAEHHWKNVMDNVSIAPIQGAVSAAHGLPDGTYAIQWWDTWKGGMFKSEEAECKDGTLPLLMPEVASDIAARICSK